MAICFYVYLLDERRFDATKDAGFPGIPQEVGGYINDSDAAAGNRGLSQNRRVMV
jgi:hypothetical protein